MGRKTFIALSGLVVVVIAGWLFFSPSPAAAPVPMPSPNGYDDFVKAGTLSSGDIRNFATASREELAAYVSRNQEALKLVRSGLTHVSRVPVEYSQNYFDNGANINGIARFRSLAYVLKSEGKMAEWDQRTNQAARIYLETMRFGHESVRGGLFVHGLIGLALEQIGFSGLQPLTPYLDAPTCRELSQSLETALANRESLTDFAARERDWAKKSLGLTARIPQKISAILHHGKDSLAQHLEGIAAREQICQRQNGFLLIDLAARAYELEKGRRPQNVPELVPDYLKAVPKDPVTGADLTLPR